MMCLMRRQIEIEAFFGGATWNVSELESGMSASSYPVLHLCTIILPVGHRNRFYPADQDRVMIPYTVTTVVLRFNDLLRDTVVLMFHLSGNARCNSHFTKGNVFPLGALAGATALACCVTHKRVGRVDPSKIHHVADKTPVLKFSWSDSLQNRQHGKMQQQQQQPTPTLTRLYRKDAWTKDLWDIMDRYHEVWCSKHNGRFPGAQSGTPGRDEVDAWLLTQATAGRNFEISQVSPGRRHPRSKPATCHC